jgi:DNA-binding NtrC family response regulator
MQATMDDTPSILLVSGYALERTTLADYLRGCGFHVIEAVDGDEATVALENKPVDIMVSDVQLRHHGSGHSISALAKQYQPGIKVILVSNAEQAAETAVDLCEDGPAEVLPYHPARLMEKIKELRRR